MRQALVRDFVPGELESGRKQTAPRAAGAHAKLSHPCQVIETCHRNLGAQERQTIQRHQSGEVRKSRVGDAALAELPSWPRLTAGY